MPGRKSGLVGPAQDSEQEYCTSHSLLQSADTRVFFARANEESRFLESRWVWVEQGVEGLDGPEQLHPRPLVRSGSWGSGKELRRQDEIARPAERSQSVHRLSKGSCSKDGQWLRDGNHPPSSCSSPFPPSSFGGLANR